MKKTIFNQKIKKYISILLAFSIIASMVSFKNSAFAENEKIYISNQQELLNFSNSINNGKTNVDAVLSNNIEITDETFYIPPIGDDNTPYMGTFDGAGYSISGLKISKGPLDAQTSSIPQEELKNGLGLFGTVGTSGVVKNLGLTSYNITGLKDVSSIAAYNFGTIQNCYNTGDVFAKDNAAGISAVNKGKIQNCYNTGKIAADANKNAIASGGEVINSFYIDTCTAQGEGTSKTEDAFSSGEVAYLLNENNNEKNWSMGQISYNNSTLNRPVLKGESGTQTYKITFKTEGLQDSTAYTGLDGKIVKFPVSPVVEGKKFDGWFLDGTGYNKDSVFTKDLTLTANLSSVLPENGSVKSTAETVLIGTESELIAFANRVNNGTADDKALNAEITADITMIGNMVPIQGYKGTFDGKNHTISGVRINKPSEANVGFFKSVVGGTVQNLFLADVEINGAYNVGALVGGMERGTINNCGNKGGTVKSNVVDETDGNYNSRAGGIVGGAQYLCVIINCYNMASVVGAKGQFPGTSGDAVGGIIGSSNDSYQGDESAYNYILNCYNKGDIHSYRASVAGIAGTIFRSEVNNCYNTGKITGEYTSDTANMGGIVGYTQGDGRAIVKYSHYLQGTAPSTGGGVLRTAAQFTGRDETPGTVSYMLRQEAEGKEGWMTWHRDKSAPNYPILMPSMYYINNLDELTKFRNVANDDFYLARGTVMADIDMSADTNWDPVGNATIPYMGIFNGQDFKIKNLKITSPTSDYSGLFGYVTNEADIKNVKLESVSLQKAKYTGALIGYMTGSSKMYKSEHLGGEMVLTGASQAGDDNIGGLIGYANTSGKIDYGLNNADLSGGSIVGGIVGTLDGSARVLNSRNTGNISSEVASGGIVGLKSGTGSVLNSYNQGSVSGGTDGTGGVVGKLESGSVQNVYSTGLVSSDSENYGAVIGSPGAATAANSYYLDTSCDKAGGAVAKEQKVFTSRSSLPTSITYLLNQEVPDGGELLKWYTSNTAPHYPILEYQEEPTIEVVVTWDDMVFDYDGSNLVWDTGKHEYTGEAIWTPKTTGSNKINIANNSNIPIKHMFNFTPGKDMNVVATYKKENGTVVTDVILDTGEQENIYLYLSGCYKRKASTNMIIGETTVSIDGVN